MPNEREPKPPFEWRVRPSDILNIIAGGELFAGLVYIYFGHKHNDASTLRTGFILVSIAFMFRGGGYLAENEGKNK